ncbi:MAG: tetratricopeptide repeat protein [Syntrophobacteraceae bacterium]|nr:tetratricopeptide repeat protein [Syntrophobacteraceae bacterium]
MATIGKRISKKTIDDSRGLVSLSERVKIRIEENYSYILGAAVVCLVVVVILVGFRSYKDRAERRAQEEYATLFAQWPAVSSNAGEWEKLIPALERFVGEHGGTRPGLNARMDLAVACFNAGRYEDSLKWGTEVLRKTPRGNDLRPLAHYQVALTYQAMERYEDALNQWNVLSGEGFPGLERLVSWNKARIASKKMDYAGALEHYESALKAPGEYPSDALLENEVSAIKRKTGAAAGSDQPGAAAANP